MGSWKWISLFFFFSLQKHSFHCHLLSVAGTDCRLCGWIMQSHSFVTVLCALCWFILQEGWGPSVPGWRRINYQRRSWGKPFQLTRVLSGSVWKSVGAQWCAHWFLGWDSPPREWQALWALGTQAFDKLASMVLWLWHPSPYGTADIYSYFCASEFNPELDLVKS